MSFWFLQHVLLKCSDILEEHTTLIIRVTESVDVDEEVMWKKTFCQLHRMGGVNLANYSCGGHKKVILQSQAVGILQNTYFGIK